MENNQYKEIIREAYNDYLLNFLGYEDVPSFFWFSENVEEDPSFRNRWGIKIMEEQILLNERIFIASKNYNLDPLTFGIGDESNEFAHKVCDEYKIPRKNLIVNYKGKSSKKY